jgi:hypothetical protein
VSAIWELASKIGALIRALDERASRASVENARQAAEASAARRPVEGEIGGKIPSPGLPSDPSRKAI